jgi:hypothetical protein
MIHMRLNTFAVILLGLALAWPATQAHADGDAFRSTTPSGLTGTETPSVSAGAGPIAGRDDGGFFLKSADDNYLMRVFGLLQFRGVGTFRGSETGRAVAPPDDASPDDDTEIGAEFRRIELGFRGHIFEPKIGYVLVLASDGGSDIIAQDILISYSLTDEWTLVGGRYFAPFLREELIGGGGSLPVALSYMNNELSVGRAEGISARYDSESVRFHAFLSDGVGGNGKNAFSDMSNLAFSARTDFKLAGEWGQWGDFTASEGSPTGAFLGGAIHLQKGESGDSVALNDVDLFSWTVDGSIECSGWHLFASLAGTHNDSDAASDLNKIGFVTQAGYTLGKFEPFARYEFLSFDNDFGYADDTVSMLTFGTNYHVNPFFKIGGDIMVALDPVPTDSANAGWLADGVDDGQVVVRLQAQLKF